MANNKHGVAVGAKFGMFELLEPIHDPATNKTHWRCRCDCGTIKVIKNISTVARGNSTSCGCFRKHRLQSNNCMFNKALAATVGRKVSITRQDTTEEAYIGPITPINRLIRYSAEGKKWTATVLARADYTCDICRTRGGSLHAHHLYGFAAFPDQRFAQDNGVCLCARHHRAFHKIHGEFNNTPQQYAAFKDVQAENAVIRPKLTLLIGCSGSGKTWVSNQLADRFHVVHYDTTPKSQLLHILRSRPTDRPILLDLPIKISTFVKRHAEEFDIRCVAIMGDFLQVKSQILGRRGKITPTLYKRWKIIQKRADKYAEFVGDSQQALTYLKSI